MCILQSEGFIDTSPVAGAGPRQLNTKGLESVPGLTSLPYCNNSSYGGQSGGYSKTKVGKPSHAEITQEDPRGLLSM